MIQRTEYAVVFLRVPFLFLSLFEVKICKKQQKKPLLRYDMQQRLFFNVFGAKRRKKLVLQQTCRVLVANDGDKGVELQNGCGKLGRDLAFDHAFYRRSLVLA